MLVFINVAVFLGIALIYQSQKGKKILQLHLQQSIHPKSPHPPTTEF